MHHNNPGYTVYIRLDHKAINPTFPPTQKVVTLIKTHILSILINFLSGNISHGNISCAKERTMISN